MAHFPGSDACRRAGAGTSPGASARRRQLSLGRRQQLHESRQPGLAHLQSADGPQPYAPEPRHRRSVRLGLRLWQFTSILYRPRRRIARRLARQHAVPALGHGVWRRLRQRVHRLHRPRRIPPLRHLPRRGVLRDESARSRTWTQRLHRVVAGANSPGVSERTETAAATTPTSESASATAASDVPPSRPVPDTFPAEWVTERSSP